MQELSLAGQVGCARRAVKAPVMWKDRYFNVVKADDKGRGRDQQKLLDLMKYKCEWSPQWGSLLPIPPFNSNLPISTA